MWSLKITTEQRYKYFGDILPDIKTDIKLFWDIIIPYVSQYIKITDIVFDTGLISCFKDFILINYSRQYKSFIIERTLDNNYQITFYE